VVRKLGARCYGERMWFILLWCEDVLWVLWLTTVVWGVVARKRTVCIFVVRRYSVGCYDCSLGCCGERMRYAILLWEEDWDKII